MKTVTLIFAFVFAEFISVGQTYSSMIKDKEIYEFLDWLATNEKKLSEEPEGEIKIISYQIEPWDSALLLPLDMAIKYHVKYPKRYLFNEEHVDTIFSIKEQKYLFKQFTSIKDTIWQRSFDNSKLWDGKEQERENRHYYSVPLYSRDRKYVLICKLYYCGNVCGYIGYYIYKRIDKKMWKGVRALRTRIS